MTLHEAKFNCRCCNEAQVISENRLKNFLVNNLRFCNVRIVKGPKSNIFTCKLCA